MEGVRESGEFKKLKWNLRPRAENYPSRRWGHTAVIYEAQLLLYGGNSQGAGRRGIHKIQCDSLEGDVLQFADCPEPRESHSCNLVKDSLYVFGGCIQQQLTNDLLQFKLAEPNHYWKKVEQKNPISPRQSHISLTLNSKTVLVYGGITPEETMLDQFWLLDLETASWQPIKDIKGNLAPKIGCTMTLIHSDIWVFGGEFGQGDDTQISNDLYIMRFQNEKFGEESSPVLNITKLDYVGQRPQARTGHCALNYKNRLLLIIGGEGVTNKKAPVLFNDIWVYNIRQSNWAQLSVEHRCNFKPRTNFTANLHKNTIYIFGGFINLQSYKSTDELVTLTLHEIKHQQPNHQSQIRMNNKTLMLCPTCKFEYVPHIVSTLPTHTERVPLQSNLQSSVSNILLMSKTIGSPIEAMTLLIDSLGALPGSVDKSVNVAMCQYRPIALPNGEHLSHENLHYHLMIRKYLSFQAENLFLTKQTLTDLIYSYSYLPANPYFDLKNAIFRLGKQILISAFQDSEFLHLYLIVSQGIFKGTFHKQAISYQLAEMRQHFVFKDFMHTYGIDPQSLAFSPLKIIIGQLRTHQNGDLQLLRNQNEDLQYQYNNERQYLSQYLKEYFYQSIPISVKLFASQLSLFPYNYLLKNARSFRPCTPFFTAISLLLNQDLRGSQSSSFIKIYARNRRVGIYQKYPFVMGAVVLRDGQFLTGAGTRVQNNSKLKDALQLQIQNALQGYKKRQSSVPIGQLEADACKKQ